jgi:hypothetical protein
MSFCIVISCDFRDPDASDVFEGYCLKQLTTGERDVPRAMTVAEHEGWHAARNRQLCPKHKAVGA